MIFIKVCKSVNFNLDIGIMLLDSSDFGFVYQFQFFHYLFLPHSAHRHIRSNSKNNQTTKVFNTQT